MRKTPRKIAVVTGSRADYGLLAPLMRLLDADPEIELQIVVCASHLCDELGMTKSFVERDGFTITAEVEMNISSDTPAGILRSMGLGCIGFGEVFSELTPDLVVVLGDRYEIMVAAQAAMVSQIPIAHLHGGEATEGAIDEAIRHSITKMSHLHFVAAEPFRKRVLQMGEVSRHVYNVGAIGLDNFNTIATMSRDAITQTLGIKLTYPLFLVTYHPVTLGGTEASQARSISNVFEALDEWPKASVVVSYSNSDVFGQSLRDAIRAYASERPGRVVACASLGQELYLNVMRVCDCVIGNSSSGLIEAPSAGVPTVNIGSRQQGRLRAQSVIDCTDVKEDIVRAVEVALTPVFKQKASEKKNPYGDGRTAPRIYEVLRNADLENLLVKSFVDL